MTVQLKEILDLCQKAVPKMPLVPFDKNMIETDIHKNEYLYDPTEKNFSCKLEHYEWMPPIFEYWDLVTKERIRIVFNEDEPIVDVHINDPSWYDCEIELLDAITEFYYDPDSEGDDPDDEDLLTEEDQNNEDRWYSKLVGSHIDEKTADQQMEDPEQDPAGKWLTPRRRQAERRTDHTP